MYYLKLLGCTSLYHQQKQMNIRSKRFFALLALVCSHKNPISRHQLATYLWPAEHLDSQILSGRLRTLLSNSRKIAEPWLAIDRDKVSFQASFDPHETIDIYRFEELVGSEKITDVEKAIELYTGLYMDGFHLERAEQFDAWLRIEQLRWQEKAHEAFETVIEFLLLYGCHKRDFSKMLDYAQRNITMDIWRDEAQVLLALIYLKKRQPKMAEEGLGHYLHNLHKHMKYAQPSAKLLDLYNTLKQDIAVDIEKFIKDHSY